MKRGAFEAFEYSLYVLQSSMRKNWKPFISRKRKLKKYFKPTLHSENYKLKKGVKLFDFDRDGGPLPETSFCKFIGFTPNYVGYQPSKFIEKNHRFQSWIVENSRLTHEELAPLFTPRETWTGGYDTFVNVLEEFTKEPRHNFPAEYYLKILEQEEFPWIKIPKLSFPVEKDLENIFVNPNAHPGFFTKMLFGDTRKDTLSTSFIVAKSIFEHLKTTIYKWNGLWTLGGRSKDIKLTKERNEKVSTRAIWIPEEPLVLLSLVIVQPFTHALSLIERNCIFIGKNFSSVELSWISRLNDFYDTTLRCDWSLFDTKVTEGMILAAMQIIRSAYPEGRHIDRYFAFLTDTVVRKNLVVSPGFVYKISKGMPSGHPMVSLINTVVNYINFVVILQKIYGVGKVKNSAYGLFSGDDTKIHCKFDKKLFKIKEVIDKYTDLEISEDILNTMILKSNKVYNDNPVRFLKRIVYQSGLIGWDFNSIVKKFIYTDKSINNIWSSLNWITNVISQAPFNFRLFELFSDYLKNSVYKEYFKNKKKLKFYTNLFDERLRNSYELGVSLCTYPKGIRKLKLGDNIGNMFASSDRKSIRKCVDFNAAFSRYEDYLLLGSLMQNYTSFFQVYAKIVEKFVKKAKEGNLRSCLDLYRSNYARKLDLFRVLRLLEYTDYRPADFDDVKLSKLVASDRYLIKTFVAISRNPKKFNKLFPNSDILLEKKFLGSKAEALP